jgi:hypothetical protein
MFKIMHKKFLFFVLLLMTNNKIFAESAKKTDESKESYKIKNIKPLPRHVLFPVITYARAPDVEGEFTVNFSERRFWLVIMLATWNEKSIEITKKLNVVIDELKRRDVGVLGLFTQNTDLDVEKWKKQNNPLFDNYFASRNLIDELNNPKIPSVWILGKQGEVLYKQELPTIQQIDTAIKKIFTLTSF